MSETVARLSSRSHPNLKHPTNQAEKPFSATNRAFHASAKEIQDHLSRRSLSPANSGRPLPYLGPQRSGETIQDDWLEERYRKYFDAPSQDDLDDLRREQADARIASDQRYLSLARDLEALDALSRSVSGRQAAHERGYTERQVRIRDRAREADRRALIDVPRASHARGEQRLWRMHQEGLADVPPISANVADLQRSVSDFNGQDWPGDMEDDLPPWASSDVQNPVRAYREAGGQARLKGRHPAQKPVEPHREARRASERRLDRDSVDWWLDEDEVRRPEVPETHPSGYSPALIAAGLLVPNPKRQQPAEPNWDAFIDP